MGTYKAAVVGLGKIGLMYDFEERRERPSSHVLAYAMNPSVDLVAAMDVREGQKDYLNKLVPEVIFHNSLDGLLKNHNLDIVSICTPPAGRSDIIEHIIKEASPKVIFCEKPLAADINEATKIKNFLHQERVHFIPNLSRRWNSGIQRLKVHIKSKSYGNVTKVHVRYTRGIFNTGAHLFDLLALLVGHIDEIRVERKISTSSEEEGELSFSFTFSIGDVEGYAEAFNDRNYYMFEIDLYFEYGKVQILLSGDIIHYFNVGSHPLYHGFKHLQFDRAEDKLLQKSNHLANAVEHIVRLLQDKDLAPVCTIDDAIYPLYVGKALLKSYHNGGTKEKVVAYDE